LLIGFFCRQGEKSITKDGKEPAGIKSPDGSVFGTKGLFGNAIDNNRNSYDPLLIATRVHANLMENLPITLLLAGLAELNGADRKKLTSVLALFTLMRVSHVFALYKCNQPARAFGRPVIPMFGRVMLMESRVLRHKHRPAGPGRVARHSYKGILGLLDPSAPKALDGIMSKCLELF